MAIISLLFSTLGFYLRIREELFRAVMLWSTPTEHWHGNIQPLPVHQVNPAAK